MLIDNDPDKKWLKWEDNTLIWGDKDGFKWEAVYILLNKVKGILAGGGIDPLAPMEDLSKKLSDKEQEDLIKVVCEVNGMVYVGSKKKSISKNITIEQINKTINTIIGVRVDI